MTWAESVTQHWPLAGLGALVGLLLGLFLTWWRGL